VGMLGWLAGWIGWVRRPRLRDRWVVLLLFAAVSTVAGLGLRAWHRRPLGIILDQTTMRVSPHGLAPAVGPLDSGGAVRILRTQPGWTLVEASGSREGWVASEAIASIGG